MFSCLPYTDYVFQSLFKRDVFLLIFFSVQRNKKGSSSVVRDQDYIRQARAPSQVKPVTGCVCYS